MKLMLCSVYDRAAGMYLTPYTSRSRAEAVRHVTTACHDQRHPFRLHAKDYILFQLGWFDEESGELEYMSPAKELCSAIEIVRLIEEEEATR